LQEKQCEESASFDLTSLDFAHCVEEVGDLLNAVAKMSESGVIADGHEAGQSSGKSPLNSLFLLDKYSKASWFVYNFIPIAAELLNCWISGYDQLSRVASGF